jgi:hypothetical protein
LISIDVQLLRHFLKLMPQLVGHVVVTILGVASMPKATILLHHESQAAPPPEHVLSEVQELEVQLIEAPTRPEARKPEE